MTPAFHPSPALFSYERPLPLYNLFLVFIDKYFALDLHDRIIEIQNAFLSCPCSPKRTAHNGVFLAVCLFRGQRCKRPISHPFRNLPGRSFSRPKPYSHTYIPLMTKETMTVKKRKILLHFSAPQKSSAKRGIAVAAPCCGKTPSSSA